MSKEQPTSLSLEDLELVGTIVQKAKKIDLSEAGSDRDFLRPVGIMDVLARALIDKKEQSGDLSELEAIQEHRKVDATERINMRRELTGDDIHLILANKCRGNFTLARMLEENRGILNISRILGVADQINAADGEEEGLGLDIMEEVQEDLIGYAIEQAMIQMKIDVFGGVFNSREMQMYEVACGRLEQECIPG